MLCLIWSNLHFLQDIPENELISIIEGKIKKYRKTLNFKFEADNFGHNFFEIFAQKPSLFDIFYDIINEKWVFLSDLKISGNKSISKDLNSKNLMSQEIIRLNPKAIQLDEIQTQIENDKESYTFLPNNLLFLETKHSKVSRYFLEFLMAYERNFLISSAVQNGKTLLIQEILRGKIEKNEIKPVSVLYDRELNIEKFQKLLEKHMEKKGFNNFGSNNNSKTFLFIDDLNMANNLDKKPGVLGCLRSLLEHKGYFNRKLGKFVGMNNIFMGAAFSYSLYEQPKIYWNLEEFRIDPRFLYKY